MIASFLGARRFYTATFYFHAELNDLLSHNRRGIAFPCQFEPHQTVKHLVESLGVPHTEIGRILINGLPVDFAYRPQDGDRVEVYSAVTPDGPSDVLHPPGELHFVLDNHLGRLAVYLRMLGLDTLYRNDYHDDELAEVAAQEQRILLTRDRRLLMRKAVVYGYCVRQLDPQQQIIEVVRRFGLASQVRPFQRCLLCNHPLQPVSKQAVLDRLEPLTKLYYDEFHICPACDQIYWKGSHYEHMQELLERIQEVLGSGNL
jgi:uncharacterized protein with PIN domain